MLEGESDLSLRESAGSSNNAADQSAAPADQPLVGDLKDRANQEYPKYVTSPVTDGTAKTEAHVKRKGSLDLINQSSLPACLPSVELEARYNFTREPNLRFA